MNGRKNLRKVIPGLKGTNLFAVNIDLALLKKTLEGENFRVYLIHGENIFDEQTFFIEVSQSLEFPPYFGKNWGAWDDSLFNEFAQLIPQRTAIVWDHADHCFNSDAQTFLTAVCDLCSLANNVFWGSKLNPANEDKQLEIIFVGEGKGFQNIP